MPRRPDTLKTARTRAPQQVKLSPSLRGYGREWRRVRAYHLAQYPLCEECKDKGLTVAASEVDHILSMSKGGTHDHDNLRSLCKPCHSRKSVLVDGALGHARNDA